MFGTDDPLFSRCVDFLSGIGIHVIFRKINAPCFLPGLRIENGSIVVDRECLKYPGDILHEAGHLAVVPGEERASLSGDVIAARIHREAEEMMAIAWSYAACMHLQIDPLFVFHDDGYKGGGSYIAENFRQQQYFGLPMLQWTGMALDQKTAAASGLPSYPVMLKWLRD